MKRYIVIDNEGWTSQFLYSTLHSAIKRGRMIYAPDGGLAESWSVIEIDSRTKRVRRVYNERAGE